MRHLIPGLAALLVATLLFFAANQQVAVGGEAAVAAKYKFQEMPIAMPPGYDQVPKKTIRAVNPGYAKISAWISSVGASIAMNDVVGHGRSDGMCVVDTRTNDVVVTYTPTAPPADRFTPFVLDAAPKLPMDDTMAPTGCTPGDFNGDGRTDFLVTYWGRTPILFLAHQDAVADQLSNTAYTPQELIPNQNVDGKYHGARWNTDAAYVGDLDGSGHPSIVIGNYFIDSGVLDPHGLNDVQMPSSLSNAKNGGGDRFLRWVGATGGADPSATYVEDKDAIPFAISSGWTLAISGADLTGDGLPELYIANDFGHGHLLYNRSTPGQLKFTEAIGKRTPTTPKSFVLGDGSFKGMGVDFADLDHTGKFDAMVSDITVAWGLEESNQLWKNKAADNADMAKQLAAGVAPFKQEAEQYGVAWTGWCWDVKTADFLNNGYPDILQADGFVQGNIDRWNWLQETAMMNDDLLSNPAMWPNVGPGDDLAGHEAMAFYGRTDGGKYVNVSDQLGLAAKIPTRGIATADTRNDGRMDFAIARQWGPPAFYANESPALGNYLDLRLYRPSTDGAAGQGIEGTGSPAYDATVTVTTSLGKQVGQLDGGGGHGGYRGFEVHFGLGADPGPVTADIQWRDANGGLHQQTAKLAPGTHNLVLTNGISEVTR